ncbi:hypothetical protein P4S72_01150 [Vibrio sp. PP-XX7]
MHLMMRGLEWTFPPICWPCIPYLATIVVMVLISSNALRQKLSTPMSLGKPFDPKLNA